MLGVPTPHGLNLEGLEFDDVDPRGEILDGDVDVDTTQKWMWKEGVFLWSFFLKMTGFFICETTPKIGIDNFINIHITCMVADGIIEKKNGAFC